MSLVDSILTLRCPAVISPLFNSFICCFIIFLSTISGAVSVDEVTEPIFGSEHDGKITLPCTFTTDSTALNITWSREYVGGKRKVAEFVNTELLAFDEFKGRVARGNQGSLVLLRPRAEDSGNYTCQAETDPENPNISWHTDPVILTIVKGMYLRCHTHYFYMHLENSYIVMQVILASRMFWWIPRFVTNGSDRISEIFLCAEKKYQPNKKEI